MSTAVVRSRTPEGRSAARRRLTARELSERAEAIVGALAEGERFTIVRDGERVGELTPVDRPRHFSADDFLKTVAALPPIDPDRFRADLDGPGRPGATRHG